MVGLAQFEEDERQHLLNLPCPSNESTPFVMGAKLNQVRHGVVVLNIKKYQLFSS